MAERFFVLLTAPARAAKRGMAWSKSANTVQFRPNQVKSKIAVKIKTPSAVSRDFIGDLEIFQKNGFRSIAQIKKKQRHGEREEMNDVRFPCFASISAAQNPASAAEQNRFFLPRIPARQNQAERGGNKQGFVDEITAVINRQGFLVSDRVAIQFGLWIYGLESRKPIRRSLTKSGSEIAAGLTIALPSWHSNARPNSGMLDGAAMARKRDSGWGLVLTIRRSNSGRSLAAQICA